MKCLRNKYERIREFRGENEKFEDKKRYEWRNRWLVESLTVENIHLMCKILKADDRFTLDKIVACMPPVECGWSTIYTIIRSVLQLQKLICQWTPHILTDEK